MSSQYGFKMSKSTQAIIEEALALSAQERARMVDELLFSLDPPNKKTDEIWKQEVEDRLSAYESGNVRALSITDVFGKYEKE